MWKDVPRGTHEPVLREDVDGVVDEAKSEAGRRLGCEVRWGGEDGVLDEGHFVEARGGNARDVCNYLRCVSLRRERREGTHDCRGEEREHLEAVDVSSGS